MEFPRIRVRGSEAFKKAALKGENFINESLRETHHGLYLEEVQGFQKNSLYRGTAGVLHMYVAFEKTFQDGSFLDTIRGLTKHLSWHALDGVEGAGKEGELVPGMCLGLYSGIAGMGLVLNQVYREFHLPEARKGAEKIIDYYSQKAVDAPEGVYWTDNAPVFFDGGVLLFLLDALSVDFQVQELIKKGTDYILSHGISHENGGLEIDYHHVDFKHKEPNFEFGTAGAGYLFTKVYELTKEEVYLEAAKRTAVYLKSIGVTQQEGYLIPYKLGTYDNNFYLGNCHGPVGTAKLFYELYKVTEEKSYLDEMLLLYKGAESLGAPLAQSWGFWNTTCVCCGPAGYIPFLLALYRETGEQKYMNKAHQVGEILVGTQKNGAWEIAFDRTEPEKLSTPKGYFNGAAGIATVLLQLYRAENGSGVQTGLIDDPYSV